MKTDILISGFGGQGVLSLGRIVAKAGLAQGKHTIWFPSYGAEIRGGAAHCFVRFSSSPMASPLVENPDIAIFLNQFSLDKFGARLKPGALIIFNEDLDPRATRRDAEKITLPLNRAALECGNIKTVNIVALGVLVSQRPGLLDREAVVEVLKESFCRQDILMQNIKAFYKGERLLHGRS